MSRPDAPHPLLTALFDRSLSEGEAAQLRTLLAADPAAMSHYLDLVTTHALLGWEHAQNVQLITPTPDVSNLRSLPPISKIEDRNSKIPYALALAAALLLAACGVAIIALALNNPQSEIPNPQSPSPSSPVATLIESTGEVTIGDALANEGEHYPAGLVAIDSGSAELMLASAVNVRLSGPTRLSVHDPMRATLTRGRAAFDVPHTAKGFTVATPSGVRVVDLGTAFEITVEPDGRSVVRVTEGLVECIGTAGVTRRLDPRGFVVCDAAGRVERELAIPAGLDVVGDYVFDGDSANPIGIGPELTPSDSGGFAAPRPVINDTDNWLIEASVRPDSAQKIGVIAYNGDSSHSGFGLMQFNGRWAVLYGSIKVIDFDAPVVPGQLVRLAAVRSAGQLSLFIDGESVGSTFSQTPNPVTGALSIGGNPGHPDQTFHGSIDRVRVSRLTGSIDPAVLTLGTPPQSPLQDTNSNPQHPSQEK